MIKCVLICLLSCALAFEKFTTSNGVSVYIQYTPDYPMEELVVSFSQGSRSFEPGQLMLMANTLDKGSKYFTKSNLQILLNSTGILFNTSLDKNDFDLHYRYPTSVTTDQLIRAIDASALTPLFPQNEIKLLASKQIQMRSKAQANPEDICDEESMRLMFEDAPRFSAPSYGKNDKIQYTSSTELNLLHHDMIRKDQVRILMIGALTPERALAQAEKIAVKIPSVKHPAPSQESLSSNNARSIYKIPFDTPQAHFCITKKLKMDEHAKNFPALLLANHILGGENFPNLLNKNNQESRGRFQMIRSYIQPEDRLIIFGIKGRSMKKDHASLEEELKQRIHQLQSKHITPALFESAKANLISRLSFHDDQSSQLLEAKTLISRDLPLSFHQSLIEKIKVLSVEEIAAVSQLFTLDQFYSVYVGSI
ncbi:MAG: hypothetical protein CMF42_05160 [Legionellales bacterium]|nr:hypothetical protein [Legionellales bacterium]OUX67070.1 MAG: hypothetical protein CBD38_03505 [bacterium TMED178]